MNWSLWQPAHNPPQEFDLGLVWQSLAAMARGLVLRVPYILVGLIVFGIFLLLAHLARQLITTAGLRTRLDDVLAELLGRLSSALLTIFGLLIAAVVIFPAFKPGDLVTGLGITSLAAGFAFKDILQNFLAGILILWRRPFQVGDQIRTRDFEGTVEHINTRSTYIKTYDGERVIVPNSDVYTNAILVRTAYDRRRLKFVVGIGYLDSIEAARATIARVLHETEGVLRDPEPEIYVAELAPSSVNFQVYFWCEPQQANVLAVSNRVATGIKLALDKAGIDLPYPHQVVLFHDTTGARPGDIERAEYLPCRNGTERPDEQTAAHADPALPKQRS